MIEAETGFAPSLAALPGGGGDIAIDQPAILGIVTVMAGAAQTEAVRSRLAALFGAAPPTASTCVVAGAVTMIGTAPGAWLLLREAAVPSWADELADALAGVATVFDQSSGYAVLRLVGTPAARLLQKGVNIDLDVDAFAPGSAAVTLVAHVGVILWRPDPTSFGIAVFRSLAGSFARWLTGAATMASLALSHPPSIPEPA